MKRLLSLLAFVASVATASSALAGSGPSGYQVIDLSKHPGTCIRLDRKVIYVGRPSGDEQCPPHLVGPRRAILHWQRSPAAGSATASPRVTAHGASSIYTGKGFDPCAAPSTNTMKAWLASPYRAVGVYVGGEDMACAQPNLTAAWVAQETSAGWHLIPTYVGKQGPGNGCGCSTITSSQAASQGRAAADDAVSHLVALGILAGNPVYYDMEAYSRGGSNTTTVLKFLSAWTSELHAHGYKSGVYSSGLSGIADLANSYNSSTYARPDEIWVADWNGKATTSDQYLPANEWTNHQRIHQYSGGVNETYGGRTLNIDHDYLDAATVGVAGTGTPQASCVVPKLRRMTYRQAKAALTQANCTLGKVHWPKHWRRHRHHLRVFSQIPKGGTTEPAGYAVRIRLTYRPF